MEMSLIREFIVLCQTLNYTKAADILHLTQPTLSKHIVAMEKEFGCNLFVRDRRRVELTDAGNVFATAAVQIVDVYDDARKQIEEIKTADPVKVSGIIFDNSISSIISIAATLLNGEGHSPVVYGDASDKYPFEQLLDDEVDIVVGFVELNDLDRHGLAYAPLLRSRFAALVSLDSPLAHRASVSIDDLRTYRFVKYVDRYASSGWENIEHVCREHGFMPRTRAVVGRNSTNYCSTPLGSEDVVILQASMPQLRYLSDFSRVKVLPVTDDDATFHLFALYKKTNYERVRHVLDAYAQARKIIINHGKDGLLVESD